MYQIGLKDYAQLSPSAHIGLKDGQLVDLKQQKGTWYVGVNWLTRGKIAKDAAHTAESEFVKSVNEEHGPVAGSYAQSRLTNLKKGGHPLEGHHFNAIQNEIRHHKLEGYEEADQRLFYRTTRGFVDGIKEKYGSKAAAYAEREVANELEYQLPLFSEKAKRILDQVHDEWRYDAGVQDLEKLGLKLDRASPLSNPRAFSKFLNGIVQTPKKHSSPSKEEEDISRAAIHYSDVLERIVVFDDDEIRANTEHPIAEDKSQMKISRSTMTVFDLTSEEPSEVPSVMQFVSGSDELARIGRELQGCIDNSGQPIGEAFAPIVDTTSDPRFNELKRDIVRPGGDIVFLDIEMPKWNDDSAVEPGEQFQGKRADATVDAMREALRRHYADSEGVDPDHVLCDLARILHQHAEARATSEGDAAYVGSYFGAEYSTAMKLWDASSVMPITVQPDKRDEDSLLIAFSGSAKMNTITLLTGDYQVPAGAEQRTSFTLRYTPGKGMAHGQIEVLENFAILDLKPSES